MENSEKLTLLLEADGLGILATLAEIDRRLDQLEAIAGSVGDSGGLSGLVPAVSGLETAGPGGAGVNLLSSAAGVRDPGSESLSSLIRESNRHLKEIASKAGRELEIEVNQL